MYLPNRQDHRHLAAVLPYHLTCISGSCKLQVHYSTYLIQAFNVGLKADLQVYFSGPRNA